MRYHVGWTTLPGLRGLSCSEFRVLPVGSANAAAADDESGVAIEFASETECDEFLRRIEEHFAQRRFTNAADAFDTVKAYVARQSG